MKKKSPRRPPMIEVRHSPIHGYGVFALRRIRKGTTVVEYLGDRISHDEADTRYEDKKADDNHTFLFTVDSKIVIDAGVGGNEARYINHGCDPNCESTTRSKRVFIEAVRTIQKGEELAYDYQIQRDGDDAPNVDEIFACRCGAATCRGTMLEPRKQPRKKPRKPQAAGARRAKSRPGGSQRRESGKRRGAAQRRGGSRSG
jgi:SET domain-containing protein